MKITCNHRSSLLGVPVILDDSGQVMEYSEGLEEVMYRLRWSRSELAVLSGYKSARSIHPFFQGLKVPSAQLLNVLAVALSEKEN